MEYLKNISCNRSEWSPFSSKIQIQYWNLYMLSVVLVESGLHSDKVHEMVFSFVMDTRNFTQHKN